MGLGEILGLLGLATAIWQILRSQTLSHATYEAIQRTSTQFGNYSLLLLIPELARIEAECEASALRGDHQSIRRHMQEWRDRAAELRGFLDADAGNAEELLRDLQRSLGATRETKRQLAPGGNAEQATAHLRDTMTQVCESARTYSASMRVDPDIPPPPRTLGGWLRQRHTRAAKETV